MLSGDEIKGLLRGEPIIRDEPLDSGMSGPRSSVPSSATGTRGEAPQGA